VQRNIFKTTYIGCLQSPSSPKHQTAGCQPKPRHHSTLSCDQDLHTLSRGDIRHSPSQWVLPSLSGTSRISNLTFSGQTLQPALPRFLQPHPSDQSRYRDGPHVIETRPSSHAKAHEEPLQTTSRSHALSSSIHLNEALPDTSRSRPAFIPVPWDNSF